MKILNISEEAFWRMSPLTFYELVEKNTEFEKEKVRAMMNGK